ncbi:Lrp/AsnC family transcriptional regulator [Candidatus Woesearchaeota archaeon]|nr:Lrp/AsnC family transcriptional regulator [Candidatus Woesearchaeota archaeon]
MEKLDVKDGKILYQLELDARQSYSNIAKKVRLSREVVNYRIKRLENIGVIEKYILILNLKKIDYESFKWYIQLENVDNEKFMEIINDFKKHQNTGWVTSCTGRWDLIVDFVVNSALSFNEITQNFLMRYSKYIRETRFTIELDIFHFKKKYLGSGEEQLKTPHLGGEPEKIELGKEDVKIITYLCENPRYSLVELAQKTKLSVDVVKNRVKKMKKNEFIQGARAQINNSKLGYSTFKILLNTKKISKEKQNQFIGYLSQNKNVWDVINCLGSWDMEVNVDVKNNVEFHNFVMDIKNKFPDIIKSYDTVEIFDNYKYNFFPMGKKILR